MNRRTFIKDLATIGVGISVLPLTSNGQERTFAGKPIVRGSQAFTVTSQDQLLYDKRFQSQFVDRKYHSSFKGWDTLTAAVADHLGDANTISDLMEHDEMANQYKFARHYGTKNTFYVPTRKGPIQSNNPLDWDFLRQAPSDLRETIHYHDLQDMVELFERTYKKDRNLVDGILKLEESNTFDNKPLVVTGFYAPISFSQNGRVESFEEILPTPYVLKPNLITRDMTFD